MHNHLETLDHALALASEGCAVFPCHHDKRPATPHGFKDAARDPDDVRSLWCLHPAPLVAIATGEASGLAVLDIDRQHDGGRWWTSTRDKLPVTRTHRTRSGGLHLVFRHRAGLRSSTSKVAPGIDIRADGGCAIWWPAVGLPVLCEGPIADWPEWLVLAAPPPPVRLPRFAVRPRSAAHVERSLIGLGRFVAFAPEGQRNGRLYWAAHRAAEAIERGELSQPHAEALLIECANRAGLPCREAASTIASVMRRRGM